MLPRCVYSQGTRILITPRVAATRCAMNVRSPGWLPRCPRDDRVYVVEYFLKVFHSIREVLLNDLKKT